MKWKMLGIASVLGLMLSLTGCSQDATTAKVSKAKTKELSFDEKLAGGKVGSDSIAFVGGGSSNKIWVIDAKYHKMLTTVDIEGPKKERTKPEYYPNLHDTHAMTFTKDFKTMFTVDWFDYNEDSYLIALDPITLKELWRTPVGKGGHHSAMSPDDKYIYVANQYGDTVSVVDVALKKKVKDIKVGKGAIYITPSMYWDGKAIPSKYLFVTVDDGGKVAVIDTEAQEVVKDIPIGGMIHGVNFTPDGKKVWVAAMGIKKVVVIDVATMKVESEIPFKGGPIHISFSPDGKAGFVTTGGNKIYRVNTKTHKIEWTATGTTVPAHTGVSPDGKELWTLNHGMGKQYPYTVSGEPVMGVQIWDTSNGKLITEIPADGIPHEIQFVPQKVFMNDKKMEVGVHGNAHEDGSAVTGEAIYQKTCISCHGDNLEGKVGPNISKIGSKLSKEEIMKIVQDGRGMMPSDLLDEKQAKIIAEWLSAKK